MPYVRNIPLQTIADTHKSYQSGQTQIFLPRFEQFFEAAIQEIPEAKREGERESEILGLSFFG